MVLKPQHLAVVAFGLAGCLHHVPIAHLDKPTPVAVAYFVDRNDTTVPGEIAPEDEAAIKEQLGQRNLQVVDASIGPVQGRTTAQRMAALVKGAGAPLVLLVEAKAVYFDQLEGRFKWTVYVRLTMSKPDDVSTAVTREFDVPVFLRFDHEKEHEALVEAASPIGERAGQLADEYLVGRSDLVAPAPAPPPAQPTGMRARPKSIYFVLVDRFANGDRGNDGDADPKDPSAFHGGDLQGVIDHLDDIQALGFDTVWLSPVWKTRHEKFYDHGAFHGYWVEDFAQIDERFGDRRLLRRLSDELHRRNMKLLLDVVLNHVAFDSPLLKAHPDWFHHRGNIEDWNDLDQLENRDVMGLPDLAQENEDVYKYLLNTSLMWIDAVKPDGFRIDAVKHIGAAFWRRYNGDVHAHAGKDFFLLGEYLDGDPAKLAQVARDEGFDALFDFPLYFTIKDVICDGKPIERIPALLSLDRTYPPGFSLVTLLDNHDLPRIATACHGDARKIALARSLLLATRGIPSVTYGTESGLTGEREPENRGDEMFVNPATATEFARELLAHDASTDLATRVASADARAVTYVDGTCATTFTRDAVKLDCGGPPVKASSRVLELAAHGAPEGPLAIVGSAPELGSWNPQRGVALEHGVTSVRLPASAVYELKLVARNSDGTFKWESRDDRFIFIPPGDGPLHVEATWNGG